jgi:hypothetical protein
VSGATSPKKRRYGHYTPCQERRREAGFRHALPL